MFFLRSFIFGAIILLLCLDVATADRYPIYIRAASSSPPSTVAAHSASPTNGASASGGNSAAETSSSIQSISKETSSSRSSTSDSSTQVSTSRHSTSLTSTSTTSASTPSISIFNATLTPDQLPLPPQITPGFAVAGVLMLLSGTVYTIIGIRKRMLHISLSAGYLSSLAVTVLIVYVMNPPVSNGIQGAYVVAITLTGLILGGASLLLMEMTEGLGCLFGGFCLSMWLLTLKPGGLLTSTGPIVIFIVCFTLAGWATSFSRYTRPYGLIFLMSFGGATVVVLGIDCFSRAGLKEFWAYIWNLNQNLFPLGATTYPLTRGMKVEIAAIVVLFLVGAASQSKLWNIIRTRREKRAADRQYDERDLSQEEEKVGRRIENATARQRVYWEAAYADKNNAASAGSGTDSVNGPKESSSSTVTSGEHSGDRGIEMDEISAAPEMTGACLNMATKGQDPVTVRVTADDGPPLDARKDGDPAKLDVHRLSHRSSSKSVRKSHRSSTDGRASHLDSDAETGLSNSRRSSKRTSNRISGGAGRGSTTFQSPREP